MGRLLAVLAALTTLALPASALGAGITPKTLTFDVATGTAGETPCKIVADLYTPPGASKADPVPAILATNGFGNSKDEFKALGPAYASRGYAFLAYSGLGFGGSGCKITLDDREHDGVAGSQLVSFLGGSKAATDGTTIDYVIHDAVDHAGNARTDDPRVGMTGGSYGGQIQFAVAAVDPRVDALNPQITWNNLEYSLVGNNTDFTSGVTSATPGVAKLDWPTLFTGLGIADPFKAAIMSASPGPPDPSHLGACPNFANEVCPSLIQAAGRGYADPDTSRFLVNASVTSYMDKIRIPTFLAQGEHDTLFDLQESVATYRALRAQGTPTKLLFRSHGHSGGDIGAAESSATNLEGSYESRMSLEWFDFYLRGLGDAPPLDFSFYRDWVAYKGDAAPAVGSSPSYPAADPAPFELSGADALVTDPKAVQAGAATFAVSPAPTSAGGAAVAGPPSADAAPGTFVSYATPPLAEDLDVAGVPSLTVALDAPTFAAAQGAAPATKLVLFAKLEDVDAAGKATVPGDIVSSLRIGDVTKPVRLELPGIVHRFAKGHELRLTVAASNALRRGNALSGPVTLRTAPSAPGTLVIPRLGTPGAPGTGASGTTPFAPARTAGPTQKAGAGGPPRGGVLAADLPSATRCASRRRFTIHLKRAPRGDRIKSAVITVNGKRKLTLRGRRAATVNLRGLPKGTARIVITARTAKGKVRRSARTYRTCTAKRTAR